MLWEEDSSWSSSLFLLVDLPPDNMYRLAHNQFQLRSLVQRNQTQKNRYGAPHNQIQDAINSEYDYLTGVFYHGRAKQHSGASPNHRNKFHSEYTANGACHF